MIAAVAIGLRVLDMRYFPDYADERARVACIHCGGPNETSDHTPSKVLLDEPFPVNLGASPSCFPCNNSLSIDEEYLACALECVLAGDVDAEAIQRKKVATILRRSPRLQEQLRRQRTHDEKGALVWQIDISRIDRVLLKLARGHAAYELSEPQISAPIHFQSLPLQNMSPEERTQFERGNSGGIEPWPEVGSRYMQRLCSDGKDFGPFGWIIVQPDVYRFRVSLSEGLRVEMVLREYLACEVVWD